MEYIYPLTAIHIDGGTLLLNTKEDAVNFYYKHGKWGPHHGEYYWNDIFKRNRVWISNWIVRDDWGRIVECEDIRPVYNYGSYWKNRQKRILHAQEKGLPIPGIRRWKWRTHHAPHKKNSGTLARARAASKYKYEIEEYELPKRSRGTNYFDPWDWW